MLRGDRAAYDTHRFLAWWKADAELTTGESSLSASEHGDACVNSVQDRGSTPLASILGIPANLQEMLDFAGDSVIKYLRNKTNAFYNSIYVMITFYAQTVEDEERIPDEIEIITQQQFEELKSQRKVYEFVVKRRPGNPTGFNIKQDIYLTNAGISAPLDPIQPWVEAKRFIWQMMGIPIKIESCAKIVNFLLQNEGCSAFILQ